MQKYLIASSTPYEDIKRVAYEGQDPKLRMYHTGYEDRLGCIPVLDPQDRFLDGKVGFARYIMQDTAAMLQTDPYTLENLPEANGFTRTILAIESPTVEENGAMKEGAEIVLAKWGKGKSSPVHGHAAGYLHEEILEGKMLVNTYRLIDSHSPVVRPVRTDIVGKGTFASVYTAPNPADRFKRQALIHNFTALTPAASLHFLPEHTRDGRDNRFTVEYFEEVHQLSFRDVYPITSKEGMYLQIGAVVLVRSTNVPEYGDHYIVITGAPVKKEHGMRPQDVAIQAPGPLAHNLLDFYNETSPGLVLLQLHPYAAKRFLSFHGITISNKEVIFPKA